MQKKAFPPINCRECLVSEPLGITYHCKFYGRAYMSVPEEKPPYCGVKSITVMEVRERAKSAARHNNGNKNFLAS